MAQPNILLIMADEFRYPRYFKNLDTVTTKQDLLKEAIKYVLAFKEFPEKISSNQSVMDDIKNFFPGLIKLREKAVVLTNHTIAATACVPSRAVMFTGHYGHETGVTQTDGIFKDGEDDNFPWLDKDGIPTTGDWFTKAGYETQYFGKCHFALSDDGTNKLSEFGFKDWNPSSPEPHGSNPANLGLYRDHGFESLVTGFLTTKSKKAKMATDDTNKPWFAVASFTNPHDITTYPALPRKILKFNAKGSSPIPPVSPLGIPEKGYMSEKQSRVNTGDDSDPNLNTDYSIPLNPDGFPQQNADLPLSWDEKLYNNNKPDCQFDFSLKIGIAAAASGTSDADQTENSANLLGLPFQLTKEPEQWTTAYLQYYTYLHYMLDQNIRNILQKLEDTGLDKNTIVVFAPDHGDYGGAHGMMIEKWHSAYQEAIHVPVVVKLPGSTTYKSIDKLTSHIDILPTLLGLAGINFNDLTVTQANIDYPGNQLIGSDLSNLIRGGDSVIKYKDGTVRNEILFVTDDMITQPLDTADDEEDDKYPAFKEAIQYYTDKDGYGSSNASKYNDWTQWLKNNTAETYGSSVCSPCRVQCVRQGNWKLVRYFEDSKSETGNQWELYDLDTDANEMKNLLVYNGTFPTVYVPNLPADKKKEDIEKIATDLKKVLYGLVKQYNAADDVPS